MTVTSHLSGTQCHICRGETRLIEKAELLQQVTSDCKPWAQPLRLCICQRCASVQKVIDEQWREAVVRIYREYDIYHQGRGVEQAVFDPASGACSARSAHLLKRAAEYLNLAETGRLLDVGCGNGAFLREFGRIKPSWLLFGSEMNGNYRQTVEGLSGVQAVYATPIGQVPGLYDVISMIHVLEHVESPFSLLRAVANRLAPGGMLLIEVPFFSHNPFDLLVADHASHFSPDTLSRLLTMSALEIELLTTDWVSKEITALVRTSLQLHSSQQPLESESQTRVVLNSVQWLTRVLAKAKDLTRTRRLGVFGTAIAGTWLLTELADRVAYFVDEDHSRVNRLHFGKPVYHPDDLPADADVFIAMPLHIAKSIRGRLTRPGLRLHLPPD